MPSTVTLAQYAMLEKNPLKKGIMMGIAQEGVIADIMEWRDTNGSLSESGVRFDSVPEPDWIPLDGTIATKSVQGKQLSYGVYQFAEHIDVPRLLDVANATQLERQSTQQVNLAVKGAAYKLNDSFINGDQAVDANGFEGINKMVADLGSNQTITQSTTNADLTTAPFSTDKAWEWINNLHLAMSRVEGHKPTAGFANIQTLLMFEQIVMRLGLHGDHHDWVEDSLEVDDPRRSQRTASTRPAFMYRGVPMYDLGVKSDQSTQVILNTYTEGSLTSQGSRIYFVKQSSEDLEGLQLEPIDVVDIGVLEDKDTIRKRLKGTFGLANWGPRAISKFQGFRVV